MVICLLACAWMFGSDSDAAHPQGRLTDSGSYLLIRKARHLCFYAFFVLCITENSNQIQDKVFGRRQNDYGFVGLSRGSGRAIT